MTKNSPIITTHWLYENLNDPSLLIIDASLKNPINSKYKEFEKVLPNSLEFDWDAFSDTDSELPHMMPSVEKFTESARVLGVNQDSLIVVYDNMGIYSSARVWWMFRSMGFDNCFVLDGGLLEWLKNGFSTEGAHRKALNMGNFIAKYREELFLDKIDVRRAIEDPNITIVDARNADRFNGKVDEPRINLRRGHIPSSINIPFEDFLIESKLRSNAELKELFSGVDFGSKLVFSCGSGVTACVGALAAVALGFEDVGVYDGSWSEWGMADE
ncbi:MAG: sulfurtransferase [Pedobacter sp.]|nr:MAG: sulfurtransferase [Pedobacter sp.]